MAQTTGAIAFVNAVVEVATTTASWIDISGIANKVSFDGGDLLTGKAFTASGTRPVVTAGKEDAVTAKADVVYSEATNEYLLLEGWKRARTACYMRVTPKGSATGNYRYTSDVGYIKRCPPPGGDAASGDPVLVSVEFETPGFTPAAIS